MPAHPAMRPMGLLYGQPRGKYQGEHLPAVAEPRDAARLLSVRASGRIVLVLVDDGATRLIRAETSDAPELAVLSAADRAKVAAAVATLHRQHEGGPDA